MKVLLVDDEKMILNGLKRALFGAGWDLYTAEGGEAALTILENEPIDVIISDMLMPGMDGAELLKIVSKQYPSIIRASLSGYSDPIITVKGGFFAHQAFTKPCKPETLKEEMARISEILDLFPDRTIQSAIGTITSLPISPKSFFQVQRKLQDNSASMHEISMLISQDPAMCAKILHIANNATFRDKLEVSSIPEAINRLGRQIIISIMSLLEVGAVSLNDASKPLEDLRTNSYKVAMLASGFVDDEQKDKVFLVGMLHHLGEYVRMKITPDLMSAYICSKTKGMDKSHLEKYLFNTKSEQLGAYLLYFWRFPASIINHILIHNDPEQLIKEPFGAACAVYVANCLISGEKISEQVVAHFELENKLPLWASQVRN
ncbi:response regulator [Vibrio sp. T187]|uniref:HDOD domain-containing protein n=1 Tax=Vibrio TaxID=662 RepID=UPI0010C994E6|nr:MULTISPECIES: HDOD domain-containing protein [Vibrio]MBW3696026.1 response regulator [Vibrio sp. T187]